MTRLLRWILPEAVADSIVGDLEEERAKQHRSRTWLLLQIAVISARCLWCQWRGAADSSLKGDGIMESLAYDIRCALRTLWSNKRFTFVALVTIVLTVGGITTVFTLVNSILLKPLPYPESDRLVNITTGEGTAAVGSLALPDFLDVQRDARSFEMLAGFRNGVYMFDQESERPYIVLLWQATPAIFPLLGMNPILGRGLLPDDAKPDSPAVGVLDYDVWQKRFGGDPAIIGKTVRLPRRVVGQDESVELTVVGVIPSTFNLPFNGGLPEVWTALRPAPNDMNRQATGTTVLGRLRNGVSLRAAQAELESVSHQLSAAYPATNATRTIGVRLAIDRVVGDMQQVLWIFFGSVACVLLIGIVNLVNLQIVRNTAREREFSIRAALGAGRGRLVRQLIVEACLLSVAGGLLGLLAAIAATHALLGLESIRFPRADQVAVDSAVYLFTLGISIASGLLFGIIPALRISRPGLQSMMNEGGRGATMSRRQGRIQQVLIGVETALALVLLVGAVLLTSSFWRLFTEETGMNENNLWSMSISFPRVYRTLDQGRDTWRAVLESIRQLPQIESAAVAPNSGAPLDGSDRSIPGVVPEGEPSGPGRGLTLSLRMVSPDYFKTVGIPVLRGRPITAEDMATSQRVAVLNESAAHKLWPVEDAVGKRMVFRNQGFMIVGIVPDFKYRRLDGDIAPQAFTPYTQMDQMSSGSSASLMVRLKPGAAGFGPALTSMVSGLDDRAKVTLASMNEMRWNSLAKERFRTSVLILFAVSAVFLALVGIFGVVSYSVVQRQREIGLRMALGAGRGNVTGLMVRQSMTPTVIGLVAGTLASLGVTRWLSSYLFKIQPTDPLTFAYAIAGLLLAAFLASFIPAHRAARVDPMIALRH